MLGMQGGFMGLIRMPSDRETYMRVAPIVWFVVLLAAATAAPPAQGQTRSITGIVVDTASRKPLAGADIYLYRAATGQRSGKDGKFQVKNARLQDTVVIVRRDGYVPIRVDVATASASGNALDLG